MLLADRSTKTSYQCYLVTTYALYYTHLFTSIHPIQDSRSVQGVMKSSKCGKYVGSQVTVLRLKGQKWASQHLTLLRHGRLVGSGLTALVAQKAYIVPTIIQNWWQKLIYLMKWLHNVETGGNTAYTFRAKLLDQHTYNSIHPVTDCSSRTTRHRNPNMLHTASVISIKYIGLQVVVVVAQNEGGGNGVVCSLCRFGLTSSRDVDMLTAWWRSTPRQLNQQAVGSTTERRLLQNRFTGHSQGHRTSQSSDIKCTKIYEWLAT